MMICRGRRARAVSSLGKASRAERQGAGWVAAALAGCRAMLLAAGVTGSFEVKRGKQGMRGNRKSRQVSLASLFTA